MRLTGVYLTGAHIIHLLQKCISRWRVSQKRSIFEAARMYLSRRARIVSPADKPSNYVPRRVPK
jgi:hypothetical protein